MQIRCGATRTVILTRRWAIKIPALARPGRGLLWVVTAGIQANLSEREWSCLETVCPVIWSLAGAVNVYRRAAPVTTLTNWDYPPLEIGGVPLSADRKPENVGVLDGKLVWIDYDQSQGECTACRRYRAATPAA